MKTTNETTVRHTPGPWHIGMKPGPMVYGPNGEQVGDLRCSSLLPSGEAGANLRLICAAPDLLDVCLRLLAFEQRLTASKADGGHQLAADIRAAVAKATE